MANIKEAFGSNNQSITCTLTSLGSGSSQASTAIDNTTNLYLDALVVLKIKTNASGTTSTGTVNVYAYGTSDGGTNYTDGVTGTDAAFTPTSPTNLKLIGIVNAVANSTTYVGGPFSVAQAFGGTLPDHWGIVVTNNTGGALDATTASAFFQGVYATST